MAYLRRQRAAFQADLQRLEATAGKEVKVPTTEEAGALLGRLADVLVGAVGSSDGQEVAAARRVVESLTGGRIVTSQHGEPRAKRG